MCPLTQLGAGANPLLKDSKGRTARDHATLKMEGGPYPFAIALLQEAEKNWSGMCPKNGHEGKGGGTDTGELGAVVMRLCSYLNVSALLVQPGG